MKNAFSARQAETIHPGRLEVRVHNKHISYGVNGNNPVGKLLDWLQDRYPGRGWSCQYQYRDVGTLEQDICVYLVTLDRLDEQEAMFLILSHPIEHVEICLLSVAA